MANRLRMAEVKAIPALHARGWSCRRIDRELGVHGYTVRRYVRRAGLGGSPSPPAPPEVENRPNLPTGSDGQNQPNPPAGSGVGESAMVASQRWKERSRRGWKFKRWAARPSPQGTRRCTGRSSMLCATWGP